VLAGWRVARASLDGVGDFLMKKHGPSPPEEAAQAPKLE